MLERLCWSTKDAGYGSAAAQTPPRNTGTCLGSSLLPQHCESSSHLMALRIAKITIISTLRPKAPFLPQQQALLEPPSGNNNQTDTTKVSLGLHFHPQAHKSWQFSAKQPCTPLLPPSNAYWLHRPSPPCSCHHSFHAGEKWVPQEQVRVAQPHWVCRCRHAWLSFNAGKSDRSYLVKLLYHLPLPRQDQMLQLYLFLGRLPRPPSPHNPNLGDQQDRAVAGSQLYLPPASTPSPSEIGVSPDSACPPSSSFSPVPL